jgi:cell fate regulator YaaT (PSP1 superfamily)
MVSERRVVGVRFRHAGKVYYFDPSETSPKPGDMVIVETVRGTEAAEVVVGCRMMPEAAISQPLRPVLRPATTEDLEHLAENRRREQEAVRTCEAKIAEHKLDMQLVGADYTFDRGKLIFYFTSEGRVDFRQLVRDLSATFRTRIELRQIGVRDEAKMLGGVGSCGRELCCCTFLSEFHPVSIRMAKRQDLSLNPSKISGLCGRLMCCLRYESEQYPEREKAAGAGCETGGPTGAGQAGAGCRCGEQAGAETPKATGCGRDRGRANEGTDFVGEPSPDEEMDDHVEVTGPVPAEEDRV